MATFCGLKPPLDTLKPRIEPIPHNQPQGIGSNGFESVTRHILLINPNSSAATSAMMLSIARAAAAGTIPVEAATAVRSPPMITTEAELTAAADEVAEIGAAHGPDCAGIVVGAFGDPGLEELRARVRIPVVGIGEASMREASEGGRRFGIATTTPLLADAIARRARDLGMSRQLAGIRCTEGDPFALMRDQRLLLQALRNAVQIAIEADGAQAVIIGGGPLGEAARQLQPMFAVPIIAPIPSAMKQAMAQAHTPNPAR